MLLGTQLRRLREAAGVTPERAGYEIRASRSKISRMETGHVGFKTRDVTDLLTLYGVTSEQVRARLLAMAQQASRPDWWAQYGDILPDWFESYLGLESVSSTIRTFELQFVHGLFQTQDYARAVTRLGHRAAPPSEIERRVGLRDQAPGAADQGGAAADLVGHGRGGAAPPARRHRGDARPAAPPHRGGRAAARHPAGRPVRPRRPRRRERRRSPCCASTSRDLPDVVYIEQLTGAVYLDQRPDVEHYLEVADQLSGEALTPVDSRRFIEQVAKET